jgi:Protein of unknown function (DUF3592)
LKQRPQNLSRGQRIVLLLFGIACCAVGFGLLVGIVKDSLYGYWRTRGKVTAEAQLRSVELKTSGGGRGGTTTSTVVRYDYEVGGQSFTGSRVAIFKPSADFYQRLTSAFRSGTPIPVFIDPQSPHFAVIDRDFALWPFIVAVPFSLTFATIGFLMVRHNALDRALVPIATPPGRRR